MKIVMKQYTRNFSGPDFALSASNQLGLSGDCENDVILERYVRQG